jgi:hypothetical protein
LYFLFKKKKKVNNYVFSQQNIVSEYNISI